MCAKIVYRSSKCFVAPTLNQNFSFKGDISYCINLERNAKRGEKIGKTFVNLSHDSYNQTVKL